MGMETLLKTIAEKAPLALEETYWLCIFAVNEHASICGDCFTCRPRDESSGKAWEEADFGRPVCKDFGLVPASLPCGSEKPGSGWMLWRSL